MDVLKLYLILIIKIIKEKHILILQTINNILLVKVYIKKINHIIIFMKHVLIMECQKQKCMMHFNNKKYFHKEQVNKI